jgi:hypothetical protein
MFTTERIAVQGVPREWIEALALVPEEAETEMRKEV